MASASRAANAITLKTRFIGSSLLSRAAALLLAARF
jgi:hypothetical protein